MSSEEVAQQAEKTLQVMKARARSIVEYISHIVQTCDGCTDPQASRVPSKDTSKSSLEQLVTSSILTILQSVSLLHIASSPYSLFT